jgi:mono/diheme cytochrome c family protein
MSTAKRYDSWEAVSGLPLLCTRACAGIALGCGLFAGLFAALPGPAQGVEPQDNAKIEAGANVYAARCSTCHGDDLVNGGGQAFDLRRLRADEQARFENSVRHGKNQMPPWQGVLSDTEIDQLWFYIRANAYQK